MVLWNFEDGDVKFCSAAPFAVTDETQIDIVYEQTMYGIFTYIDP